MNRILIAKAEPQVVTFLQKGLEGNGFTATVINGDCEASLIVCSENFDLLLLDLDLLRKDGLTILKELRLASVTLPIIVITERDNISDKISGLERGANDYVTKPFHFDELLARIRVWLRKSRFSSTGKEDILKAGNIILDLRSRQVWVTNCLVKLSIREFNLARIFLSYPGQVLSREKLINCVWGNSYISSSNIVDVYVRHLRRKLGSSLIKTMKGVGYYLQV